MLHEPLRVGNETIERGKRRRSCSAEKEEGTTGSSGSFFVARGPSRIRLFKEVPSKEKKRNPRRGRCPFSTTFRRFSVSPFRREGRKLSFDPTTIQSRYSRRNWWTRLGESRSAKIFFVTFWGLIVERNVFNDELRNTSNVRPDILEFLN